MTTTKPPEAVYACPKCNTLIDMRRIFEGICDHCGSIVNPETVLIFEVPDA